MKPGRKVKKRFKWRIHNPFYGANFVYAETGLEALKKLIPEHEPEFRRTTLGYGDEYFLPIDPLDTKPQVRNYWTVMLARDYIPEEKYL